VFEKFSENAGMVNGGRPTAFVGVGRSPLLARSRSEWNPSYGAASGSFQEERFVKTDAEPDAGAELNR
jgi:hypothetical protein